MQAFKSDVKFVDGRDEFGLPKFVNRGTNVNNNADKVFENLLSSDKVFHDLKKNSESLDTEKFCAPNEGVSGVKDSKGKKKVEAGTPNATPKPWSQVLKNAPPVGNSVKLEYVPLPKGTKIVSPPDEVLRKGNDKLKFSIVGSFSKGTLPYRRVSSFAFRIWKNQGLISVFQKDNHTFIFKFASES